MPGGEANGKCIVAVSDPGGSEWADTESMAQILGEMQAISLIKQRSEVFMCVLFSRLCFQLPRHFLV